MEEKYIVILGGDQNLGGKYNMVGSFASGLYKAMKKLYPHTALIMDAAKENVPIYSSIGFNVLGEEVFDATVKASIPHLMWCDDSTFNLMTFFDKYSSYDNFFVATTSPLDIEPMKMFYPKLPVFYMPLAVDRELWEENINVEKETDIVFLSSLIDVDEIEQRVKKTVSAEMSALYSEIYEYTYNNSELGFWHIFKSFAQAGYCELNDHRTYEYMLKNIVYRVTFEKRIEMLKKLKNFNVKVYGDQLWEKYVEGNIEYMGPVDIPETAKVIQKAKITMNLQPIHLQYGLQERILNPACAGSMVITDNNIEVKKNFGDSIVYYDSQNFENLEDMVEYYVNNDDERLEKTKRAQKIAIEDHNWEKRSQILLRDYFNLIS